MNIDNQAKGDNWMLYNADCVDVMQGLPNNSIDMSVFSPPYSALYCYSNSDRDMGNCRSDSEFYEHFKFVIGGLRRVIKAGRIVAVDVMNIPAMKGKDGYIGLKDFRGDVIRLFQDSGFIFHSEHCIWKDPLIEATRTKSIGLMHKQLCKDSTMCRAGIPQYLLAFRRPGDNEDPVSHPHGLQYFIGEDPPTSGVMSHEIWRRYASPVWMDCNPNNTLQYMAARNADDEKHIAPMSMDIINRAIELWTNPGDVVLSPFAGIGSEGYCAVKMGRKSIGIELKESYFNLAVKNMESTRVRQLDLFSEVA